MTVPTVHRNKVLTVFIEQGKIPSSRLFYVPGLDLVPPKHELGLHRSDTRAVHFLHGGKDRDGPVTRIGRLSAPSCRVDYIPGFVERGIG
jgi:hypothetical protein